MSRFHSAPSTKQPSAVQLSTPPPVACNLAETSLSHQVGGDGYSKHLAARRSMLAYRIRCRGSSGRPKLAIAAELSIRLDRRVRADLPSKGEVLRLVDRAVSSHLSLSSLEAALAGEIRREPVHA